MHPGKRQEAEAISEPRMLTDAPALKCNPLTSQRQTAGLGKETDPPPPEPALFKGSERA